MDKTIRRNEFCIIGQPRCDFVFSSTRNCFIAYGFEESTLEMTILKNLLKEEGIQADEAGGMLAPAQNAFCVKICAKIINSQFCVVLLNNDLKEGKEIPNANINMEYGLMLGFNKCVVTFQKESQKLPFNVAGLDTIKYNQKNFEQKAREAIKKAIELTRQDTPKLENFDQIIQAFIISKRALITSIDDVGNRNIYELGSHLGFNLLNDFSGFKYIFLGNFSALRTEIILWRLGMLNEIVQERLSSFDERIKVGLVTQSQADMLTDIFKKMEVWIIVTSNEDKNKIIVILEKSRPKLKTNIFSRDDIISELSSI